MPRDALGRIEAEAETAADADAGATILEFTLDSDGFAAGRAELALIVQGVDTATLDRLVVNGVTSAPVDVPGAEGGEPGAKDGVAVQPPPLPPARFRILEIARKESARARVLGSVELSLSREQAERLSSLAGQGTPGYWAGRAVSEPEGAPAQTPATPAPAAPSAPTTATTPPPADPSPPVPSPLPAPPAVRDPAARPSPVVPGLPGAPAGPSPGAGSVPPDPRTDDEVGEEQDPPEAEAASRLSEDRPESADRVRVRIYIVHSP